MERIVSSFLIVALVATVVALLWAIVQPRRKASPRSAALTFAFHAPLGFLRGLSFGSGLALANIAEGTHPGLITKLADGAYGRHLMVKIGSDNDHVALAGTADIAIGVIDDESGAAEDPLNVVLLGSIDRTFLAQASAAVITAGNFVVTAANGQVRALPATTGTYYIIGRALNTTAGNSGDLVEIDPINNTQRVVP